MVAILWLGSQMAYGDDLSDELSVKLVDLSYGHTGTSKPPRFAFTNSEAFIAPKKISEAVHMSLETPVLRNSELGVSADRKTGWQLVQTHFSVVP